MGDTKTKAAYNHSKIFCFPKTKILLMSSYSTIIYIICSHGYPVSSLLQEIKVYKMAGPQLFASEALEQYEGKCLSDKGY